MLKTSRILIRFSLSPLPLRSQFRVGSDIDLNDVWRAVRPTDVVGRGAKLLCTGPWCLTTGSSEDSPATGLGKLWHRDSCIEKNVQMHWQKPDTKPARYCKICNQIIRQAEAKLDLCIKDKALEPLKVALKAGKEVQASVAVVRDGEQMMARLLAEQALGEAMDETNQLRPPKTKKDIALLVQSLEDALELQCDPKKILKAQALSRTVEAELRLLLMHHQCQDIEMATNESLPDMQKFTQYIEEAKTAGAQATLVSTADQLRRRLTAELNLQYALHPPLIMERLADGSIIEVDPKSLLGDNFALSGYERILCYCCTTAAAPPATATLSF
eukprot:SAG31_NODE_4224_length_3447_cov_2.493130_3_plen_329_part_00